MEQICAASKSRLLRTVRPRACACAVCGAALGPVLELRVRAGSRLRRLCSRRARARRNSALAAHRADCMPTADCLAAIFVKKLLHGIGSGLRPGGL